MLRQVEKWIMGNIAIHMIYRIGRGFLATTPQLSLENARLESLAVVHGGKRLLIKLPAESQKIRQAFNIVAQGNAFA